MMITEYKIFENLKEDFESVYTQIWEEVQSVKHNMFKEFPEMVSSVVSNLDISSHLNYITMRFDIIENNKYISEVHNILQSWCEKLVDSNNIYMTHRYTFQGFTIYLKKLKTERIITERFLYHVSKPINRSSIRKHGLLPKGSSDSKLWFDYDYLAYPPAVFATNMGIHDTWHVPGDIWRIDTNGLKNEWWYDLNFYGAGDRKKYVMTFDPIPKKYIKFVKDGNTGKWFDSPPKIN